MTSSFSCPSSFEALFNEDLSCSSPSSFPFSTPSSAFPFSTSSSFPFSSSSSSSSSGEGQEVPNSEGGGKGAADPFEGEFSSLVPDFPSSPLLSNLPAAAGLFLKEERGEEEEGFVISSSSSNPASLSSLSLNPSSSFPSSSFPSFPPSSAPLPSCVAPVFQHHLRPDFHLFSSSGFHGNQAAPSLGPSSADPSFFQAPPPPPPLLPFSSSSSSSSSFPPFEAPPSLKHEPEATYPYSSYPHPSLPDLEGGYSSDGNYDDDLDDDESLQGPSTSVIDNKPRRGGKHRKNKSRDQLLPAPSPRTLNDPELLQQYRQERNRLAAKRSRERKKDYIRQLEGTCRALKEHNDELVRQVLEVRRLLREASPSFSASAAPASVPPPLSSSSSSSSLPSAAASVPPASSTPMSRLSSPSSSPSPSSSSSSSSSSSLCSASPSSPSPVIEDKGIRAPPLKKVKRA